MARERQAVAFLDTHVLLWLYEALNDRFSNRARDIINSHSLQCSAIALLELQYLNEIGRFTHSPLQVITFLRDSIGLEINIVEFSQVINAALTISWTRDVFDRIIVAETSLAQAILVTKDRMILDNYSSAAW